MSLKLFNLQGLELQRLYPFEALAEISDFVAGLVQRVPKKPNEVKVDLQNSTASQGDCSCEDNLYRDPSTSKANAFFAQDDQMGGLSLDKC